MTRVTVTTNEPYSPGFSPTSVAITNDGQLGFVALRGGKVAMINLLERQVIYKVAVTGVPRSIITGLFTPDFLPALPARPRSMYL